jgi:hypothetical protein
MHNYTLQGTDGCYESARAAGEKDRIWLRKKSQDMHSWTDLAEMEEKFLPSNWKKHMETAKKAGHGGGDFLEILDFTNAIEGKRPCPIGIHEAMDITLPGLVSQESIRKGSKWLEVPDSRRWK